MKTREKILETARILFNEVGYTETTLRQIAQKMGISQGNLNYHFKKKNDILETLYFNLVREMDKMVGAMLGQISILQQLFHSSGTSMKIFYEYRFFLRDIYTILRSNKKLKTHYIALQQQRKKQFLQLFEFMKASGLLRSEEMDNEYERLYERMNIVGDNWLNSLELQNNDIRSALSYYHVLLFEMIYPYLTIKGKQDFHKIC